MARVHVEKLDRLVTWVSRFCASNSLRTDRRRCMRCDCLRSYLVTADDACKENASIAPVGNRHLIEPTTASCRSAQTGYPKCRVRLERELVVV